MKRHEVDKLIARIEALESEVAILRARPPVVITQPMPVTAPYTQPSPFIPPWGITTCLEACTVKTPIDPRITVWN